MWDGHNEEGFPVEITPWRDPYAPTRNSRNVFSFGSFTAADGWVHLPTNGGYTPPFMGDDGNSVFGDRVQRSWNFGWKQNLDMTTIIGASDPAVDDILEMPQATIQFIVLGVSFSGNADPPVDLKPWLLQYVLFGMPSEHAETPQPYPVGITDVSTLRFYTATLNYDGTVGKTVYGNTEATLVDGTGNITTTPVYRWYASGRDEQRIFIRTDIRDIDLRQNQTPDDLYGIFFFAWTDSPGGVGWGLAGRESWYNFEQDALPKDFMD